MTQREVVRFSSPVVSGRVRTTTVPCRLLVGRVLSLATIVLCGFLLAAQSANAETFTIKDLVNTALGVNAISVEECSGATPGTGMCTTADGTHLAVGRVILSSAAPCVSVGVETPDCIIILPPTGGGVFASTGFPPVVGFSAPGERAPASDALFTVNGPSFNSVKATFEFDSEIENTQAVPALPSCNNIPCQAETGNPVSPGTGAQSGLIFWTGAAPDQIFVQSDVEVSTVPEPSSLILLGSGLLMAGGFLRRRLATPSA